MNAAIMITMKIVVIYSMLALAGLIFGGTLALWMTGLIGARAPSYFSDIDVNGWTSDRSIGSASGNAYIRARVARHGLLALAKEEAIYFTRNTDDDGDPLLSRCAYALNGGPQDAFGGRLRFMMKIAACQ